MIARLLYKKWEIPTWADSRAEYLVSVPLRDQRNIGTERRDIKRLPKFFTAVSSKRLNTGFRGLTFEHDNASAPSALKQRDFWTARRSNL
ncbi:hypothetical protein EVAR_16310_1 [Eumeta japonica]|uniref:Uncharacterized protein n=1 Tax=Eumeta variegata TaxID=151549 RepID=A0A4C1VI61_EUMVA|nr:hypothetical protein EVAR_16310_1 [Eumeta japonica]